MRTSFFLGLIVFFLYSCSNAPSNEVAFSSSEVTDVKDMGLRRIELLRQSGGHVYASDFSTFEILKLANMDLTTETVMGGEGHGPGEFYSIKFFDVFGDSIYAFVDQTKMHVFTTDGAYRRSIDLPAGILPAGRFAATEDGIVLFRRNHEHPLVKIDLAGNVINEFGRWVGNFDDARQQFVNNASKIVYDPLHQQYIRMFTVYPLIEFYDLEGNYLHHIEFTDEPILSERHQFITEEHKDASKRNATYHLIEDVTISENQLALLVYNHNIGARDVLLLEIERGNATRFRRYAFDDKPFSTLTTIELLGKNTLLAFSYGSPSAIYTIKLD